MSDSSIARIVRSTENFSMPRSCLPWRRTPAVSMSSTFVTKGALGVTKDEAISRITIVTSGPPHVIEQIMAQLDRLVPVHKVTDLTENPAINGIVLERR